MQCKYHPKRQAVHSCNSCGAPLCPECAEEVKEKEYYCFQCAMFQTVSGVGTTLKDKREQLIEKREKKKKKYGPFHYFLIISSSVILAMWGVILFGGKMAPVGSTSVLQNDRAFLFLVDSAIKKYAHYKNNDFPEQLAALVPTYLPLKKNDLVHLNRLTYQRDPKEGYFLSLSNVKPGEMKIILSVKGIKYQPASGQGA
jgi:hypothetical protein